MISNNVNSPAERKTTGRCSETLSQC